MFNRRLKKDKKKITKYIRISLIILVILFTCFGVGYSLLSQRINISGKATIKNEETVNTDFDVEYTKNDDWYNDFRHYYNISFFVINNSTVNTTGWEVSMDVPSDVTSVECWKANNSVSATRAVFKNLDYNAVVMPNGKEEIGFILNTGVNDNYRPTNIIIKVYTIEKPGGITIPIENTEIPGDDDDGPEIPEHPDHPELSPYINVEFVSTNSWMEGGQYVSQYNINITNISTKKITSWELEVGNINEFVLVNSWNANYVVTDTLLHFSNMSYNNVINAGTTIQFGCILKSGIQNYIPKILSSKVTVVD